MKLEVAMLVGAESKQFLVTLTEQIDRLEKLTSTALNATSKKKAAPVEEPEETDEEETEDEAPVKTKGKAKPAAKKKAAAFDEDEETEDESEDEEEETDESFEDDEAEEEEAPPVKAKGKAKKLTADDCNDACKAYARDQGGGKEGRDAVLKLLKKNFKTASISEIDPSNYAKLIALMKS